MPKYQPYEIKWKNWSGVSRQNEFIDVTFGIFGYFMRASDNKTPFPQKA